MNTLEEKVMANIALIYVVRTLTSRHALKLYALLLSVVGLIALVSLPNVAANFMQALSGGNAVTFVLAAVVGTTILVQAALFVGTLAALSLLVDIFRTTPRMLRA